MAKPKTETAKTKAPAKAAEASAPALPPEPRPEEAFHQVIERARALPPDQVKDYRADAELALYNVRFGLLSLLPFFPTLPEHLPKITVDALLGARTLAAALVHADDRVGDKPLSPQQVESKLERLRLLRGAALEAAEMLANRGLLPAARVKKIRQGAGRHDAARDGVDLEQLFGEYRATVQNKHPLSDEELTELGALGHTLVQVFPPPGATQKTASAEEKTRQQAAEVRNRIWTLLLADFVPLRQAGHYFFLDEVDEHVPPLQSRRALATKPPAPTPPAAPGAP
jgi:hypothetical protein